MKRFATSVVLAATISGVGVVGLSGGQASAAVLTCVDACQAQQVALAHSLFNQLNTDIGLWPPNPVKVTFNCRFSRDAVVKRLAAVSA